MPVLNKKILENEGVILKGHFLLTSGLHSDIYFEKFRLLENPGILTNLVSIVLEKMNITDIDYVIGPVTGGIIAAYEFARQLNCRSAYLEKRNDIMGFYRGTPIEPHHRILLVDDVLTTGKSVFASIDAVKNVNDNIAGIGILIDRSSDLQFEYDMYSAIAVDAVTYKPDDCPLCREGIPLIRPGGKR